MWYWIKKYGSEVVDNAVREMESIPWVKEHLLTKKIRVKGLITSWERIPSISKFTIKLGPWHPMLRMIGVSHRTPNQFEFESGSGRKANQFMKYQIKRLLKYKEQGEGRKFWKLVYILMRESTAFRVSAVNHVFYNWYKKKSLWFILNVNRKADKILKELDTKMEYHRVYIEKQNGKYRPLGVPEPEWRLVLHMLNNFIHLWIGDHLLPSQHGFQPGKGCLSAWREIFKERLLRLPYIYECDLRNFFNEVDLPSLRDKLEEMGVPREISRLLHHINMSAPDLPLGREHHKVEERPQLQKAYHSHMHTPNYEIGRTNKPELEAGYQFETMWKELQNLLSAHPGNIEVIRAIMEEDGCADVQEFLQLQWALYDSIQPNLPDHKMSEDEWKGEKGVPQGSPTSPLLSMVLLPEFLKQARSISYADDPVFFGTEEFTIKDDKSKGLLLAPEKSGWVKYAGKWLKPLKFLGLEYNQGQLRGSTRNGATLIAEGDEKRMLETISEWEKEHGLLDTCSSDKLSGSKDRVLTSWKQIFSSKLSGWLQAALYNDQWDLSTYQDFSLKWTSSSWLAHQGGQKPGWSTFTVSSYASLSLMGILAGKSKWKRPKIRRVKVKWPRGRPRRRTSKSR